MQESTEWTAIRYWLLSKFVYLPQSRDLLLRSWTWRKPHCGVKVCVDWEGHSFALHTLAVSVRTDHSEYYLCQRDNWTLQQRMKSQQFCPIYSLKMFLVMSNNSRIVHWLDDLWLMSYFPAVCGYWLEYSKLYCCCGFQSKIVIIQNHYSSPIWYAGISTKPQS